MKLRPEEILQSCCAQYLRVACPDVLWWSSGNGFYVGGGKNRFAYIDKMKKLGLLPGVPDLQLIWASPQGPMVAFIELKAGKNKPTAEQLAVMSRLQEIGLHAEWVNSFDAFVALLKKWEVPNRIKITH